MKPDVLAEVMKRWPKSVTEGLNRAEELRLRKILVKIQSGARLSLPVFLWSRACFVSPAVEVVFWRRLRNSVEVLLKRRPKNDPIYGRKIGVVGACEMPNHVVAGDHIEASITSLGLVLDAALVEIGLKSGQLHHQPKVVDQRLFAGARGPVHQTVVIWRIQDERITGGRWYPIRKLPPDIIGEHRSLIALAAKYI